MFVDGVLQLFPPFGLDQSILAAVLFGMLLLLFLTEMFGWVFVGLVVPGYLASIAVIEPASAIAVLFESMLTFVLVRLISESFAKLQSWSPFFGRERFLLIVMVSVVVRQNSQIWILPWALRYLDNTFGTALYTDLDFYSIGLVLIPLTANMCWKLGVWRGSLQIAVPTSIVYVFLYFVLLPFTNLSFGNLALTYENVALDFLGSPKAYIILLTGAFLAARYNVKYGWDYNGIMVPSLLALAWFSPMMVLVTMGEALILLGAMRLVMALPMMRTINLEGPRKVSMIFILGFLLKYVTGWIFATGIVEGFQLTDFFGFGYVLTSLIAVKMLNARKIGRVLLPTAQVSLMAFVIGSLVGYGLEQIAPADRSPVTLAQRDRVSTRMLLREPLGVMALAQVRARPLPPDEIRDGRPNEELRDYACLWRGIDRWLADDLPDLPAAARMCAQKLNLVLRPIETGPGSVPPARVSPAIALPGGAVPAVALMDQEERLALQTGWETALLFPGAPGPYIEVPSPRLEEPAALAATFLCRALRCRGILVSGGDSRENVATNALAHPQSTFQVAHRQLRSAPVIQLRADDSVPRGRPVLHLEHTLSPDIDLKQLWQSNVELSWQPPPAPPQQWGEDLDLVVLRVHPADLWQRLLDESPPPAPPQPAMNIERFLTPLVEGTEDPLALDLRPVILPSESELRFFETLLADDLLHGRWDRIPWLGRLAEIIDYEIVFLPDCSGPADGCWVLMQNDAPTRYPMGFLAVRAGQPAPIAVEVPRPERELGTLRIATELWIDARGHALLVNPDEKLSGPGIQLDPTIIGNPVTPFQAGHQAIHRSLAELQRRREPGAPSGQPALPGLIVQLRGFAGWRPIDEDMVIGIGPPVMQPWQIPALLKGIVAADGPLGWLSDSMRYADGSDELISLAGQGTPQLTFTRAFGGVDFALVWLSEDVRQRYRPASRARYAEHFEKTGLVLLDSTVYDALHEPALAPLQGKGGRKAAGEGNQEMAAELDRLLDLARHYAITRDIHVLRALARAGLRNPGIEVRAMWSEQLSLPLMRVQLTRGAKVLRAVVLLHPVVETPCEQRSAAALGLTRDTAPQELRRCGVLTSQGTTAR